MSATKPFAIDKWLVYEAYQAVKANAGSAGVDKESIGDFEKDLKGNLYKIWNRMSSGSYFPPPVKAVAIPKKNGGERILGVPTVADRVAQTVVKRVIEPGIEAKFLPDSYGYRPGRSALDAVGVTRERCWKYSWVLEFDIKGLFDNIDHALLEKALEKHVECKRSAHPPLCAHDHAGFLRGNSSSMRLFGQEGSFFRVSVSQAMGSIPFARAVSSSD